MSLSSTHVSAIKNRDGNVTVAPSKAFQHEIVNVSISLLFFITMYFVIVAAFLGLAFLSICISYFVLSQNVNFITIFACFGLIGLNLMVIFFLLKFIFQKSVTDRSGMIEIFNGSEPKLFQFIKEITDETNASFPKKIYLTTNVNAGVFYDSSFWSMFLPVKKNLQIGLGLVNSTNIAEFKAILAHEFAHFSQKSMRFGSYVYHVNSIIYNMLYDNEGYGRVINSWANLHGIFSFFAKITIWIVMRIQWVMQKLYAVVNLNYLGLSREMEFHADALATVTAGSNNMRTALLRLEPGDLCFNKLLEFYELWINESIKTENIYPQHRELMRRFALDNDIEWNDNEMVIGDTESLDITPRRINIKDQWASHPSLMDRLQHIMFIGTAKTGDHSSAWSLFTHPEDLQKEMTAKIYERIEFDNEPQAIGNEEFIEKIDNYFDKQRFDIRYKGYFDTHDLTEFNAAEVVEDVSPSFSKDGFAELDKLLNKENLLLTKKRKGLQADIELLDNIINKTYSVKTFDFDGNKLKVAVAPNVRQQLKEELKNVIKAQLELDKDLFRFFYSRTIPGVRNDDLIMSYELYIKSIQKDSKYLQLITDMFEVIRPFYVDKLTVKAATALNEKTKQKELEVKTSIHTLVESEAYLGFVRDHENAAFKAFIAEDRPYFEEGIIRSELFKLLVDALNAFQDVVINHKHSYKAVYLNLQLSLLENQDTKKKLPF